MDARDRAEIANNPSLKYRGNARFNQPVSVQSAVASQLSVMTHEWPADASAELLVRIRRDLAREIDWIDDWLSRLRGGEAA